MKKTNLIIWAIIIIASIYALSSISSSFDIDKIDSPIKEIINSTSTKFYFDGTTYESRSLPFGWKKIFIRNSEFYIKIVQNEQERAQGLSGVDKMDKNVGMFFIFDTDDIRGFWMKDMNFPIDVLWIDENMKIVEISSNFSPKSYPEVIRPKVPVRYVLEINAGIAIENGLTVGDIITY